jgi:hypothetical protein
LSQIIAHIQPAALAAFNSARLLCLIRPPAAAYKGRRMISRRDFLRSATAAAALAGLEWGLGGEATPVPPPWYRRTLRWGQTNITEIDPQRYDIAWWRRYWKRTRVQGVIINAGGIFAYYPSQFPLHHRPAALGERDLYGELCRAAHEDGLAVLARMDSNRAAEAFYRAHPDWFAVDASGQAYKAGDLFVSCVNSPYYYEYLPGVLREIIERSHPEGITDNSWSGLGRNSICYCEHCARSFGQRTGRPIPREKNWRDPVYREWIRWSYARRLEIWDLNNRVTRAAGGPDCLWVGMNSGSVSSQCASFRDYREICRRAEIIMLDHQTRDEAQGFQHNGEAGKLIHGLLGWDKLIPESMAMYQAGRPTFRLASKPAAEARLWMIGGIAGGLQPWWHHVGAYHEDRRMYQTAEPIYRWHEANAPLLVNRRPVASVAVLWSQANMDFYGRDQPEVHVEQPFRGMTQALVRARIPYLPLHADDLEKEAANFAVLVLPNLAAMSDRQVAAIRRFAADGGSLVASGDSSLFNESGEVRPDFALGDIFGAHLVAPLRVEDEAERLRWAAAQHHTYLRLAPELRARVDGPRAATEPPSAGTRHPVLRGFDETDILPFGGVCAPLRTESAAQVLATFIPAFPIYPPETAWMREPRTSIPGLIVRETARGGRVAFLPADLDRRFGRDSLPDHGDLLANVVRWAAKDRHPFEVEGPGLIDCHLYLQGGSFILHLVNLTSAAAWRGAVAEFIPVGPIRVRVRLPEGRHGKDVRLLVANQRLATTVSKGWSSFRLEVLRDHEVVVVG